MKTVLVTGGAGFIGSHFIKRLLTHYPSYRIINMDSLTYAGNLENLKGCEHNSRYVFVKGDIRDRDRVDEVFTQYQIDQVVNLAAETHVDRSIEDPSVFLTTNILGTEVLLNAAMRYWKVKSDDKHSREYKKGVKFLHVSTDEVYGSLDEENEPFTESMPLLPNSPYAASKASADMVVRAYHITYGLPVNITRCSNNYGPFQFPEKLIPLMINNAVNNQNLPVYGDGKHMREWLHVSDHCSALDAVLHEGKDGELYNISGKNEKSNNEIVKSVLSHLGKSFNLINYIVDRPGHDRRYAVDSTKIEKELGWKPKTGFKKGMNETIEWYQNNQRWIESVTTGEYKDYYRRMYKSVE